ncbi:hypothetical protein EIN_380760 [Entamoeba invadens IP1]|uniref:Peptidase S74 domain-containing protein n=1 Tax=Entamoeba invadens IP1 TaxID=370355 RepID=A0A0A1UG13_ENTIV|nr:hypothetical protein EIN_380760 [Entamoeba invadens IP1]ELP92129.1 hypothetical protein EIN_380760 [Entamoeba invadens IP1]|eukprot:XP_004258900.1 hypothetical protein EIN_380760 [Entamoeba invadens IP1]
MNNEVPSVGNLVLVSSSDIPRTRRFRKKNWKCTYPHCTDPPKTKYNVTSHIWDSHLRTEIGKPGNNPHNLVLTTFKDSPQKEIIKQLCEPYMVKLVDKITPKTKPKPDNFPFAFEQNTSDQNSDINHIHTNSSSNSVIGFDHSNEMNNEYAIQMEPQIPPNSPLDRPKCPQHTQITRMQQNVQQQMQQNFENATRQNVLPQPPHPIPEVEMSQQQTGHYSFEDFVKIEKINENLRQLHVLGEVFAENGFLVRSDARAKTDIEEIHSALSGVLSLDGVSYAYKNNPTDKKYGFVAQEIESIYPDLVKRDRDGNMSVDYIGVIPILVEALKEINRNAEGMKNDQELTGVSLRVDSAINRLEKLLFEADCKNLQKEESSKFEQWKSKTMHIFGPVSFLIFACLFSSILSIILPIVFPSMYFLMCASVVLSVTLWIFVFINRKEAVKFLMSKRAFFPLKQNRNFKWTMSQYITWYITFSLFFTMVIFSILIGSNVFLAFVVYIIAAMAVLVVCYFVNKGGSRFGIPYQYSLIVLLVFQACAIGSLVLCTIYQRKKDFGDESKYVIHITENVEVTQVEMPKVSWNCFSPSITTEPDLPAGLHFETSQRLFSLPVPVLAGKPTGGFSDSEVKVSLECNGIVLLDFPTLYFKSCALNSDPGVCSLNSCGYCRASTQQQSFCGICGSYFDQQCKNVSGLVSNC